MEVVLAFLVKYGPVVSALGAGIAFAWTVIQFLSVRAREAKNREFENFHKLIKELVEPPVSDGIMYIDRQCAIVFELRFFPRYYPVIRRILMGLKIKWTALAENELYARLIDELAISLKYIDEHGTKFQRLIRIPNPVNY